MSTHIVGIGAKPSVLRRAVASGRLRLSRGTIELIRARRIEKGDVLTISEVAALQAVKRTPDLLPLCHPIPVTRAHAALALEDDAVVATVEVEATYRTGVEMEALTATTVGLLCAWDLVKAHEKDASGNYPAARIDDVRVLRKEKEGEL